MVTFRWLVCLYRRLAGVGIQRGLSLALFLTRET